MKVTDLLNNAALEFVDFPLPSKGKVYPSGLSSVKIRPTKTTEEKFLRTIARGSSDFNEKISKYIGLITNFSELGLDPIELTVPDQLALLIYSRILSKDTVNYPTEVACPSCGKVSRKVINLMELKVIELPDDYTEPQEICLPLHDLYLGVRLLRIKDHMNVADFHRTMLAVNNDLGDTEADHEGLYASIITSVRKNEEKISLSYSDRRELLKELDARSFNLIVEYQDKYYHGYDLKVSLDCPHCLNKNIVEFGLDADFFFKVTSTAA
jgi:hypothetical protein